MVAAFIEEVKEMKKVKVEKAIRTLREVEVLQGQATWRDILEGRTSGLFLFALIRACQCHDPEVRRAA